MHEPQSIGGHVIGPRKTRFLVHGRSGKSIGVEGNDSALKESDERVRGVGVRHLIRYRITERSRLGILRQILPVYRVQDGNGFLADTEPNPASLTGEAASLPVRARAVIAHRISERSTLRVKRSILAKHGFDDDERAEILSPQDFGIDILHGDAPRGSGRIFQERRHFRHYDL
jgi:hypothetical protein